VVVAPPGHHTVIIPGRSIVLIPSGWLPPYRPSARLLGDGFVQRYTQVPGDTVDGLPARTPSSPARSGWPTTTP
jgi:hypothetical protein